MRNSLWISILAFLALLLASTAQFAIARKDAAREWQAACISID